MNNTAQMTDEELDAYNKLAWEEGRLEDMRIRLSLVPAADLYPMVDAMDVAW